MGHTMDNNFVTKGKYFSGSSILHVDSCQPHGQDCKIVIDQAENLAQETVIALFDKVVPGGFGTVESNWKAIFHQHATAQAALGDNITPSGRCRNRFPNAQGVFPFTITIQLTRDNGTVCMGLRHLVAQKGIPCLLTI